MTLRLAALSRSAAAAAVLDRIDGGGAAGNVKVYTGVQPATADDPATGTLLVTITFGLPAFGYAASGVAPMASPPRNGIAVATGTAGWARFTASDGTRVFDGEVTATGDGGEVELSDTAITAGKVVELTGGTYTHPGS